MPQTKFDITAPDPSPPSGGYKRIVALLVAFSFMTWFNRLSMAVAYDTKIGPRYGITEEAIGTVYSAFFLSYLLFMAPGGLFIDRYGPKLAVLIMGFGSGLFGAFTGFAGLVPVEAAGLMVAILLVIRFAMGMFSAPFYPASARMISIWVPLPHRAFANGWSQSAANIGMACAFPVFGAMIDLWDWPMAFVASGIVTIGLGLVWWVVAPKQPAAVQSVGHDDQRHQSALALLRNRNVILLTLSYATIGYLEYLFFFWMNHYFGTILTIDKDWSRVFAAILFLAMAVGVVGGGWLADRLRKSLGAWLGRAAVPMAGMTFGAIFLGFGVISSEIAWIVFWLALALFAVGATESPTWTAAVEFGGKHGGTSAAILNTGGNLGGFVAPFLTPIVSHGVRDAFGLSDLDGWRWGITLAGALCLGGATLWWWIRPEEKQSAAGE